MKFSTFLAITFLALSNTIYSQTYNQSHVTFYFGDKTFKNATVLLNNGKTLLGEIHDFESPNVIEIYSLQVNVANLESDLHFDRKEIKFRESGSDEYIKLDSDSINEITYYDKQLKEEQSFKRLRVVKSSNGEILERSRNVFLPLIKKDSINLYGYHLYMNEPYQNKEKYMTTIVYLNNNNSNEAITPFDANLMEMIMNKNIMYSKFIDSYRFVSNDCEDFMSWLNSEIVAEILNKDQGYDKYKELQKVIKEGKKQFKSKEDKKDFEMKKYSEYYVIPFDKINQEYKQRCN
ncbi:hypothetical protein ACFS5J_07305 [Flavobacterium chuncheonense]|uniref:YARHG domain-containing protein n=1 Tax=Flavobacterium chuncheonense TaxID=2026653 RepID=A0ABW5YL85_9FLAO